jgi:exosortase/archaeosortase family protein
MPKLLAKKTYQMLLVVLVITLMFLPFLNVFSYLLSGIAERTGFYKLLENYVTPYIVALTRAVLGLLGLRSRPGQSMLTVYYQQERYPIMIGWNCLGWQSMVIFFISLLTGLSGQFTRRSKAVCILIGTLGTFLFNLLRIVASILAIIFINRAFALVLHDYLMILLTIIWLLFFWWLSYRYVLEEK